ncbi:hypothetical protein J7L05_11700 [bacterium]|nr:hypothetical protein [bacterium]
MEDGSKDPQSNDEQVAGRMLFPNSGMRSPYWSEGPFLPFCPAPEGLIPDLRDGSGWDIPKRGNIIRRPDWHPRPNPGEGAPDLSPPEIDPGFDVGGAMLMPSGYNNPNYGLPSDGGGAFIGMGRFDAACNIPNEMQPGIPPGGLFGPDALIPDLPEFSEKKGTGTFTINNNNHCHSILMYLSPFP